MTRTVPPEGVPKVVEARRVGSRAGLGQGGHGNGDFTYAVLADPPVPQPHGGDRRRAPRQRTRLRSGKLVTLGGTFLTECLIYDLSTRGCRIRLSAGRALPSTLQLYDDHSGLLHRCVVLWREGSDIGIRFIPSSQPDRTRDQAEALRRKFYAVRD